MSFSTLTFGTRLTLAAVSGLIAWPLLMLGSIIGGTPATHADEWTSFDVSAGHYNEVRRESITLNRGVACEIQTDDFRLTDKWNASVNIIFSSTGSLSEDVENEKAVRLSFGRWGNHEFANYNIDSLGFEDNYDNYFRIGPNLVKDTELILVWLSDDTFEYQIHDALSDPFFGILVVPNFEPKFAFVTVAGVAGRIRCRSVEF